MSLGEDWQYDQCGFGHLGNQRLQSIRLEFFDECPWKNNYQRKRVRKIEKEKVGLDKLEEERGDGNILFDEEI